MFVMMRHKPYEWFGHPFAIYKPSEFYPDGRSWPESGLYRVSSFPERSEYMAYWALAKQTSQIGSSYPDGLYTCPTVSSGEFVFGEPHEPLNYRYIVGSVSPKISQIWHTGTSWETKPSGCYIWGTNTPEEPMYVMHHSTTGGGQFADYRLSKIDARSMAELWSFKLDDSLQTGTTGIGYQYSGQRNDLYNLDWRFALTPFIANPSVNHTLAVVITEPLYAYRPFTSFTELLGRFVGSVARNQFISTNKDIFACYYGTQDNSSSDQFTFDVCDSLGNHIDEITTNLKGPYLNILEVSGTGTCSPEHRVQTLRWGGLDHSTYLSHWVNQSGVYVPGVSGENGYFGGGDPGRDLNVAMQDLPRVTCISTRYPFVGGAHGNGNTEFLFKSSRGVIQGGASGYYTRVFVGPYTTIPASGVPATISDEVVTPTADESDGIPVGDDRNADVMVMQTICTEFYREGWEEGDGYTTDGEDQDDIFDWIDHGSCSPSYDDPPIMAHYIPDPCNPAIPWVP
jgi:hypothetical protein